MKINAGMRLKSTVCSAEVVVIKTPSEGEAIGCGGELMCELSSAGFDALPLKDAQENYALLGKRYVDEESGLELLCSKQGLGMLSFEGRELVLKQPKPLPSSD